MSFLDRSIFGVLLLCAILGVISSTASVAGQVLFFEIVQHNRDFVRGTLEEEVLCYSDCFDSQNTELLVVSYISVYHIGCQPERRTTVLLQSSKY